MREGREVRYSELAAENGNPEHEGRSTAKEIDAEVSRRSPSDRLPQRDSASPIPVVPISRTASRTPATKKWLGLAILTLPCAIYSMDLTVMELAIPTLSAQLKPTAMQLLWMLDIYGFVLAGMLIPMGALAERFGRRRLLLIGAGAFSLVSIGAAFATNSATLIVMRAALGAAGATIAPTTLSLIRQMFEVAEERERAIGVWAAAYSVGAGAGPLVGGYILQQFGWKAIFLIGLPAMLTVILLGPKILPEYRNTKVGGVDFLSAGISLVSVLTVILGLKMSVEYGPSLSAAAFVGLGIVLGVAFVHRQMRLEIPLIDFELLRTPTFPAALAIYSLVSFVSFGSLVFVAQYMQLVLGLSPLKAGLWGMPFALMLAIGSSVLPWLERCMPRKAVLCVGLYIAAIGFGMLCSMQVGTAPGTVAAVSCVYAFGLACAFTSTLNVILEATSVEQAGTASTVAETSSELGGALGIALLGSLGFAVYRSSLHGILAAAADGLPPTPGAAIQMFQVSTEYGSRIVQACREAFVSCLHITSGASAVILVGAAMLALCGVRGPGKVVLEHSR